MKPSFIVLCGGEGSGKSTATELIKRKYLPNVIFTREPGGSTFAEKIRDLMFKEPLAKHANAATMFGLAWASRAEHMMRTVIPALMRETPVVCDRFDCCTYAYQIYAQGGSTLTDLFWTTRDTFLSERKPDLYIFLDVSPAEGLRRVAGRPGKKSHFDEQDIAFHHKVREGYLAFFKELSARGGQSVMIDASQSQDQVGTAILAAVAPFLKEY